MNKCYLYDSDVGKVPETSVDVGARPFHFEPRRVRRDMQPESNEEDGESETNRLGNTDW